MTSSAVEAVMGVPLFVDLDQTEVQLLAGLMTERTFLAGETVTIEGTVGDGFFVVESGEAEVMAQGQYRGTIASGDCFGEIALLMGCERTATITVTSDLHCYSLTSSDFRVVAESSPCIAFGLYQLMADRLS